MTPVKYYPEVNAVGMPVKLSDALVKLARTEAEASDRSITAQIEHWAKLGRSVETALGHEDVLALKGADGNLTRAFPGRRSSCGAVRAMWRSRPSLAICLISEPATARADRARRAGCIDFTVILRASEFVDQYLVKHEFVKRLHQRYRQEDITIPFPIRTLVQRQGQAAAE